MKIMAKGEVAVTKNLRVPVHTNRIIGLKAQKGTAYQRVKPLS